MLALLILATRILAARSPRDGTNANAAPVNADLSLLNLGGNGNGNTNAANENGNANTNGSVVAVASSGEFPDRFLADYCPGAVSEFGSKKLVSLTFDAGAGTASYDSILATLADKKAPAVVFMTGQWAAENSEVAKAIADAGLGVYSHSYDHPSFIDLPKAKQLDQLTRANAAIAAATGIATTKPGFRPPFGDLDSTTIATVRGAGYCPILWTVDALDWQDGQTADASKQRVLDHLKPGAIVLMQIGTPTPPQFLPDLIDQIRAKGYTLVGVPDLFAGNPVPVKQTTNANSSTNGNRNAGTANTNGG